MKVFLNRYKYILFFASLIVVYAILDYQTILFLRPQGIHFWRQTDSLSFVANYFNTGFHFFEPEVFNLVLSNGKTAAEFPILYYISALLYLVFGQHEFILRLITIIIVSFGFFSLFKLLILMLNDVLYALLLSFLFLSSTVLLFYTNNFIPDPSALGFVLAGWYYFYYYLCKKKTTKYLMLSFALFTIGSLLKITFFMNPIAGIVTIIINGILEKRKINNLIKHLFPALLIFVIASLLVLSWNLFATYYNKLNNSSSLFLMSAAPIWEDSQQKINEVWKMMTVNWFPDYYYPSAFRFFISFFIFGILFIKKSKRIILIPSILLVVASLCYLLLFFHQFQYHDYYFIAFFPAIIFAVISSFVTIKNKFPALVNNYLSKLLILALCILSINYARVRLKGRYSGDPKNDSFAKIGVLLANGEDYINSLGISKDAKVIIFTDYTPQGGLYFLNRKGYPISDTSEEGIKKIEVYKNLGAEYLINTTNIAFDYPKIGENKTISVYKIK